MPKYNIAVICCNSAAYYYGENIEKLFDPIGTTFPLYGNDVNKIINAIKEPGVFQAVLFLGGEDVSPSLYGEPRHYTTHSNEMRDKLEAAIYKKLTYENAFPENVSRHCMPKIGICRGAQFLNVMNRGKLVQDTTGHTRYHHIKARTLHEKEFNRELFVSSTHHQMMIPSKLHRKCKVLGYAEGLSAHYKNGLDEKIPMDMEYEILLYPKSRSLCHQPHPEYMDDNSEYKKFFLDTVVDLIKYKHDPKRDLT